MIRLVLSDVDGTLVPLGAGRASKRTMAAIQAVQDAGVRFGLATGRDVMELMQIFGDDTPFRTGILSNGKKIMVDGEIARLTLINNDALARAVEVVREFPHTFATAYPLHTDSSNPIYCMGTTQEEMAKWSVTYAFNGILANEVPDVEVLGATIATNAPEDMLDELQAALLAACPEFDIGKPALRWWDLLPKGLNKGSALTLLMQELGVSRDEVVMFGDADNDLAILQAVEDAVVVAGATPAAKAAAKWHIGACEDEATSQALEDIAYGASHGETPAFMRS